MQHCGSSSLPDLSPTGLMGMLGVWLAPHLAGVRSKAQLAKLDWLSIFKNMVSLAICIETAMLLRWCGRHPHQAHMQQNRYVKLGLCCCGTHKPPLSLNSPCMRLIRPCAAASCCLCCCHQMTWDQQQQVEREAPAQLLLPTGTRAAISYSGAQPTARARMQEVFGFEDTPRLGGAAGVPLLLELLSPASRPLQVRRVPSMMQLVGLSGCVLVPADDDHTGMRTRHTKAGASAAS